MIITLKGAFSLETNPITAASKLDTDASPSCGEFETPHMSTNCNDVHREPQSFAVCIPWPLKAKLVSTASCNAPAEPERILTIATSRLRVSSIRAQLWQVMLAASTLVK